MPPETIVAELAPGERQLVEIAKALHREADLIIFDEPTTSLTPRETARLFDVIRRLKRDGRTIIYISHILGDVAKICDAIAVLRDGRLVDQGPAAGFDVGRMIRSMIGRELENRREEGLMMDAPVAENLSLVAVRRFGRGPLALLDRDEHRAATEQARTDLGIRAADIAQPAGARALGRQPAEGGDRQVADAGPAVFILDEPTRGVDVGAKYEIYALIDRLAAEGNAILFISSELEELTGMCDRIIVMSRGEVAARFDARPFDRERILAAAFRETVT
jgi:ribose transport system ATP-binding protein